MRHDESRRNGEERGELLTLAGAARVLGLSRSTLYRLRAAGGLPEPVVLRGRARWRRSELAAWMDAGCPSADRWGALRGGRR